MTTDITQAELHYAATVGRIFNALTPFRVFEANRVLNEVIKRLDESVCPECGEFRPYDDRVLARMKCGPCAYGAAS